MEELDFPFKDENQADDLLISLFNKRRDEGRVPEVGPLKISVKTACCYLDKNYNLLNLCKALDNLMMYKGVIDEKGFPVIEKTKIESIKYTKVDNEILVKNSKKNNNFFNSINVLVKIRKDKNINLMIFTNGRITCTGSLYDDDGYNYGSRITSPYYLLY